MIILHGVAKLLSIDNRYCVSLIIVILNLALCIISCNMSQHAVATWFLMTIKVRYKAFAQLLSRAGDKQSRRAAKISIVTS